MASAAAFFIGFRESRWLVCGTVMVWSVHSQHSRNKRKQEEWGAENAVMTHCCISMRDCSDRGSNCWVTSKGELSGLLCSQNVLQHSWIYCIIHLAQFLKKFIVNFSHFKCYLFNLGRYVRDMLNSLVLGPAYSGIMRLTMLLLCRVSCMNCECAVTTTVR